MLKKKAFWSRVKNKQTQPNFATPVSFTLPNARDFSLQTNTNCVLGGLKKKETGESRQQETSYFSQASSARLYCKKNP